MVEDVLEVVHQEAATIYAVLQHASILFFAVSCAFSLYVFCQRLMQFFGGKNSFSTEILCEHLLVLLWMFREFFQHNTRLIYNCNRLIGNRIWQIKWYYLRAPTTTRSSLNCIQNLSNLAVCRCKQI